MINVIVILLEDIGKKDFDNDVLFETVKNLHEKGKIEGAPVLSYKFSNYELFSAFTTGMEAVGKAEDYAYVWEDNMSPRYEEQHENYSRFEVILKHYMNN